MPETPMSKKKSPTTHQKKRTAQSPPSQRTFDSSKKLRYSIAPASQPEAGPESLKNKDGHIKLIKEDLAYFDELADNLKNDPQILKAFVESFQYKNKSLSQLTHPQKQNKALIHALLDSALEQKENEDIYFSPCSYDFSTIGDNIRSDYAIMLKAVQIIGENIQYASDKVKRSPLMIKYAILQSGHALEYIDQDLVLQHPEIAYISLYGSFLNFLHLPEKFYSNKAFVLNALKSDPAYQAMIRAVKTLQAYRENPNNQQFINDLHSNPHYHTEKLPKTNYEYLLNNCFDQDIFMKAKKAFLECRDNKKTEFYKLLSKIKHSSDPIMTPAHTTASTTMIAPTNTGLQFSQSPSKIPPALPAPTHKS